MTTRRLAVLPLVARLLAGASLLLAASITPALPAQAPKSPTFTEHIAPLVYASCTRCHRPGEAAPFALLTYADTKKRARNLLAVIEDRTMPPWHPEPGHGSFRNTARLANEQIETFRNWVATGMAEGPREALPPVPAFPSGWQLGEPDLVLTTKGAFEVPARGRDVYRNFALPVDLPEDRWITAIEVRPSARSVLHHTLVFLDENRESRERDGQDGRPGFSGMQYPRGPMIASWAVGGIPERLPDGLAIKLPKHSDLMLQSHLHPSGKKELEQTTIGVYFAEQPPERTLVSLQLPPFFGFTAGLDIPAGEADYRLRDSFELPTDVEAVRVGGHAHMLCRSMKMWAEQKDGTEIPLLYIKAWDFDWQSDYTYARFVPIQKGATVHVEIVYDNSKDNPNNPNKPPKRVRWGRETTDEMGSITLLLVPKDEADREVLQRAVADKTMARAIARAERAVDQQFDGLDTNRDGKLDRSELPRRMQPFFEQLDLDKDGKLSKEEAKGVTELLRGLGRGLGGGLPGGLPGAGGGR